jgi:hypothetical protein
MARAVRQGRPVALYLLILVLLVLSVGALYGGYHLITDSSGGKMGLPVSWLERTGFPDYLIPGLILFTMLGVLPLITVFLLWFRPQWSAMQGLENFFHIHWVWGMAFGIGLAQVIWIGYQVATMGLMFWLQPTFFAVGLVVMGLCLLPSLRHYYAR